MNPKTSARAEGAAPSNRPVFSDAPRREVLVHVLLETFDLYVRSVAEITAETGLLGELTIEILMAYAIGLPEADELIHGFIRGDLTLFPPAEQNRQLVDRDTRRLELETPIPELRPATRLGRKLAPRQPGAARPSSERSSDLHNFIKDNPEVFRQVRASSHEFLVRWVILHLMEAAQARQRVHRVAHEFWKQFPGIRQGIEARMAKRSPMQAQSPQTSPAKRQSRQERTGIGPS